MIVDMSDPTTNEDIERLHRAFRAAKELTDILPEYAEAHDADVGGTALIVCGIIASRIVSPESITREEFFAQMNIALNAKEIASTGTTKTQ